MLSELMNNENSENIQDDFVKTNIETNKDNIKDTVIELQLGDVIHISDLKNEKLNDQTFIIDYIDQTKILLINVDSFEKVKVKINEDSSIGDGTISKIAILSRSDVQGYSRQNNLLTGTWINIYFEGDIPTILTGQITNLEEDMIEIRVFPEGDVIYINFDYKGIPEDLPIQTIEIREEPQKNVSRNLEVNEEFGEEPLLGEEESEKDILGIIPELDNEERYIPTEKLSINIPIKNVKDQLREFILKADQISFGDEEFGPIVQYVDVTSNKQRYSIETQVSDLLDELLSTIPNNQRTQRVLNNIHIMIERFKQLREKFSVFDKYGNIEKSLTYESNYKPLITYFETFKTNLFWILPVVKNVKKIYDASEIDVEENNDIINIEIEKDISQIKSIIDNYKSDSLPEDQSKYSALYSELNPYFTPFLLLNDENIESMIEKNVDNDLNVIIDNLDDMYSSIFYNNNIRTRRFVIQKYNLGLNKLDTVDLSGGKNITKSVKLTYNDTMSIKSFVTLPEPVIRFSRINLPSTNILDKASLNQTFLNLWQFLKKKTNINTIFVDNLNEDIEFNEDNFVNNIKNFVLNIPTEELNQLSKVEIYNKFIQTIVPKTKILFRLMKKYITGKLSIVDVVSYLEPFLIYTDNLTYMQYVEIIKFINEKISDFNKKFLERLRLFLSLTKVKGLKPIFESAYSIISILEKNPDKNEIFESYNINYKNEEFTNSEILRKMTIKDSLHVYSYAVTLQNIPLMFPSDFSSLFDEERKNIQKKYDEEESSESSCKNIVVAKMYKSLTEMENDNNRDIYFDKRFDSTNYGIIDKYDSDMVKMAPEDFIIFLTKDLKKKMKLNDQNAEYLAETLISGYKRVLKGQYALLYKGYKEKTNEEYDYYIRQDNMWVLDESVDKNVISNSPDVLCNLQEKCISVPDNYEDKCQSMELDELGIQNKLLKDIVNEFDEKYKVSKQEFQETIQKKFDYFLSIMGSLSQIETSNMLKYNNEKYKMGSTDDNTSNFIISPYIKIRDLILSQQDFSKKQNDIIRFVNAYTRKAFLNGFGPLGELESVHWLYCVKTNTKLLPVFKYDLASVYLTNKDGYDDYIELLKARIGKLSDDGDTWVDEHSGWSIANIDFDLEEGYEAGFKVSTRAILEAEIGNEIGTRFHDKIISSQAIQFDTPESRTISNIVNALSQAMGIPTFDSQKSFIINCVNLSLLNTEKEKEYNRKIRELANKTSKIMMSYKDFYNSAILYYTLGMFLIAVQTSIPSIKTRKTFPGCIKSFNGYPFEGTGDLSSLNYLACVTYSIRKSRSEPWNVLSRTKEASIAAKIKASIDEVLLSIPEVKRKFDEKTEYLLLNPGENFIPDEYTISNWTQFLPPLIPFKIKKLLNISPEFESELIRDLKSGSERQREKILVIDSKIIQFSLAIQERIQEVVKKKQVILQKQNNEPYLENACCNDKSGMTTIQYFENEDSNITEYNKIVERLTNIMADIISFSKGGLFLSKINTKNKYPSISNSFDDKTIYLAFIQFCKFKTLLPIPEDLLPLCDTKPLPGIINTNDSLSEIIRKLKDEGRNYSNESFLRLLQLVSRNNIVDISYDNPIISSISRLLEVLDSIDSEDDNVVEPSLRKLIFNCLDTYSIAANNITKETKELNNFLIKNNENMKEEIIEFIIKYKGSEITKRSINQTTSFINTISDWSSDNSIRNEEKKISNDSMYNSVNFFKTFIEIFVIIFPNIILNKVDYKNISIPKYWNLSVNHSGNIKKFISSYYDKLRSFYDIPIIYSILSTIQKTAKNLVLLSKETPCFTSIKYTNSNNSNNNYELKPVFDERTSKYLFEYILLRVLINYIDLTDEDSMTVTEIKKNVNVNDVFTVEYLEEMENRVDTSVDPRSESETVLIRGNKKELRQKTVGLLISFIEIMKNHKETIDYSYDDILDRIFKLKEREKDLITDRLKNLTDEERDTDTILKINKLGVWSKGLQKGLTSYVKENYDEEIQFRENMEKYERKIRETNKNANDQNIDQFLEDYVEEMDRDAYAERDAYNMEGYTEDYENGNFEGDEVENFEDYD